LHSSTAVLLRLAMLEGGFGFKWHALFSRKPFHPRGARPFLPSPALGRSLDVSRIRAITLDLDDTLWPIWPTIRARRGDAAGLARASNAPATAHPVRRTAAVILRGARADEQRSAPIWHTT
jgi:hypothetical protein